MKYKVLTHAEAMKVGFGSGCQGEMDVSYQRIVDHLGPPSLGPEDSFDHKIDASWILRFADGEIATIYNYKTGRNWLGPKGPTTSKIRDWHVGGKSNVVVDRIKEILR